MSVKPSQLLSSHKARWVSFDEALEMLDFKSEREVVEKARDMIEAMGKQSEGESGKWESRK